MKCNASKLLCAAILMTLCISQSNICNAQNLDTRKGWDLRGHGFDTAMSFVVRYSPQLPIIIGISTTDDKFLEVLKKTFREMDWQGYENIAVIIHDFSPDNRGETYGLTFYKKGDPVAHIGKGEDYWGIVFIKELQEEKRDIIMLPKDENLYPITLIKTQVKMLYKE